MYYVFMLSLHSRLLPGKNNSKLIVRYKVDDSNPHTTEYLKHLSYCYRKTKLKNLLKCHPLQDIIKIMWYLHKSIPSTIKKNEIVLIFAKKSM